MYAKDDNDLRQRVCTVPWHHFEVGLHQDVYLCCPGFLPVSVGNLSQEAPFTIWNSAAARAIRGSIIDGSFRYCKREYCPDLVNRRLPWREQLGGPDMPGPIAATSLRVPGMLEKEVGPRGTLEVVCDHWPTRIELANDRSCNLACPSCRPRVFMPDVNQQEEVHRSFQRLLSDALTRAKRLRMNGAGEFLASRPCRGLLKELSRERVPDLRFEFITNGQLFSPDVYDDFDLTNRIEMIYVSVDAASSSTYSRVRPGGNFASLLRNIGFMDERRSRGDRPFYLTMAFVASVLNFHEMPAFVRLSQLFNASVSFSRIRNWGHFSEQAFALLDVSRDTHPMHSNLVRTLRQLKSENSTLDLGDLASCFRVSDGPNTGAQGQSRHDT